MTRRFMASAAFATALALSASNAFAAKDPKEFIKDAIQGDNSEIMLGQLAQQKAASPQMRQYGQMLVIDHSKAKDEASSVAKTLGVNPPDNPTSDAQDEQMKLSKLSGDGFDKEFAKMMIMDHQKDIQAFEDQAKAANGPASDLAAKQLPVLQKHLAMAQTLAANDGQTGAAPAATNSASEQEAPDQWRASKLAGVAIYGPDNKKVGTISDVLMSKDGKAEFVIVGVGGFLGIGEKDVSIPYGQVKFSEKPIAPTAVATGAANTMGASAIAPDPTMAARSDAYPDHGTIDMTADQLKNAPAFHFAK